MIVAVTGITSEARIARAAGFAAAICGGGDRNATETAIAAAIARGASALVSFGIAGGLAPALLPGAIIVGDAVVIEAGGQLAPMPLASLGAAARRGPIYAARRIIADAAEKRAI